MAIVQTLDKYSFVRAFEESSRKDQFSSEALEAIFDYLEEYSEQADSNNIEFDIVGICCEWAEEGWEGIAKDHNVDLEGCEDDQDKIEAVRDHLEYHTQCILLPDGETFVYVQF
jgi:hypothetical protein